MLHTLFNTNLKTAIQGFLCNASKPHIMILDKNEIFAEMFFFVCAILYKVAMACAKILMQSLPKWQN